MTATQKRERASQAKKTCTERRETAIGCKTSQSLRFPPSVDHTLPFPLSKKRKHTKWTCAPLFLAILFSPLFLKRFLNWGCVTHSSVFFLSVFSPFGHGSRYFVPLFFPLNYSTRRSLFAAYLPSSLILSSPLSSHSRERATKQMERKTRYHFFLHSGRKKSLHYGASPVGCSSLVSHFFPGRFLQPLLNLTETSFFSERERESEEGGSNALLHAPLCVKKREVYWNFFTCARE